MRTIKAIYFPTTDTGATWRSLTLASVVCVFCFLYSATGSAQDVKIYADKPLSAGEMANMLFPEELPSRRPKTRSIEDSMPSAKPKTRSIVISTGAASAAATAASSATVEQEVTPTAVEALEPTPPPVAEKPRTFGLLINFAFNSSNVSPESRPYLDEVGKMLQFEKLADKKILIEGHADAKGNAYYNKVLSLKRAEAIKRYLVQYHGISNARLFTEGKGEADLLAGKSPYDPLNRRVQFYAVP